MKQVWTRVGVWIGYALLAACTSSGPTDNPVVRTWAWFSYVNGEDLRATCQTGSPDRYRLIYNGNYLEQRRTYDLTVKVGGGATVAGNVIGEANLVSGIPLLDPLAPWRGVFFEAHIESGRLRVLREALAASGAGGTAPKGLELPSDSFYWTAAICENGVFHFNAWAYPSPAFAALSFVDPLLASDTTGIPLNKARPIAYLTLREREEAQRFVLKVGDNGLAPF